MARARMSSAGGREGKAALDLVEALGSSLEIDVVLQRSYPSLLRMVDADHAALGVSRSGRPEDFTWTVADLPPAFFASYADMAPHDFVRVAVTRHPNRVLRDEEMVRRCELETNMMYHRAREVGAPLEQVMAVMLQAPPFDEWQSGLAVYRDRRRPFSASERAALQAVTPAIVNAVRNCERFGAAASQAAAIEAWLNDRRAASVLVSGSGRPLALSVRAAELLERWFASDERRPGQLPAPLADRLSAVPSPAPAAPPRWSRAGTEAVLHVSFTPLPAAGASKPAWMLVLEERRRSTELPAAWRAALTPRQAAAAAAVLRGWDNRLIASELGCTVATVKRHLQSTFDKLGVGSRAALIALARELLDP